MKIVRIVLKNLCFLLLGIFLNLSLVNSTYSIIEIDAMAPIGYGISELNTESFGYGGGMSIDLTQSDTLKIQLRTDAYYIRFKDIYISGNHYYVSYRRIPIFIGPRFQFSISRYIKPYVEVGLEISIDRYHSPSNLIGAPFGYVSTPDSAIFPQSDLSRLGTFPQYSGSGADPLAALRLAATSNLKFVPRGYVGAEKISNTINFGVPAGGGVNIEIGSFYFGVNIRYHMIRQAYITFTPSLGFRI